MFSQCVHAQPSQDILYIHSKPDWDKALINWHFGNCHCKCNIIENDDTILIFIVLLRAFGLGFGLGHSEQDFFFDDLKMSIGDRADEAHCMSSKSIQI